jgi:hypothetical protein
MNVSAYISFPAAPGTPATYELLPLSKLENINFNIDCEA